MGLPLEFLLIAALLSGSYKRFPFVFFYAVANLVTTIIEIPAYTDWFKRRDEAGAGVHAARVYWYNEWVLQVLVFAVVISLIYYATTGARLRRLVRSSLIAGAIMFAGVSFFIHYGPPPMKYGYWMTPWTRDLNFGAAILDLALWAKLIASRERDHRLLLISGALGMQFTGEAIGEAIRNLSIAKTIESLSLTGSVVTMLADLACLYVWWQTFRPRRAACGQK